MSTMKLVAFALMLFAPLSEGNPDIPVVDDSDKLDIQKWFYAGIQYGVLFQNIYINKTKLGDKCLFAQRQRPTKTNKIKFSFWNGQEGITALANVAFSSSTATDINDQMLVQGVEDNRLTWLQAVGDPYKLLFANGFVCMVIQVPRSHVPEDTIKIKEPDGMQVKYCVVLVASDSLQEENNIKNCTSFFAANCGMRRSSPRIKSEKCFKAFLPTEAST
uniref:Putative secreted protein n=1 Tax=Amblyomma triste TaxID=251400 RepID=A0A023G1S7_AMBTT